MIRLLLGGSPCTHWSIAQSKNRETEPSGEGWELFKNYLIAKEKFRPDIFLYENNKSAAPAIKNQISKEIGADLMYINSALVSAQNRQRFYCFNWTVEQPEDRGILLADVLESGMCWNEKAYALTTAEVIIHILSGALRGIPRDEEIVVLSMYDGIATGRYCLDKLGFKNVRYYAYEIDKYAKQVAMNNYPDIIQCGDAFRVRDDDWRIEGLLTA